MKYATLASAERINAALEAVRARGIAAEQVADRREALARLRALIPAGATVNTGASLTLKEIGFEDLLKSADHPWRNLKAEVLAETDPARQRLLRRQATLADYFVGSVHALARSGELVVASLSGSQVAPYVYSAANVIWVVGAQKIVEDVDDAIRRVREYVLPHEHKRMLEMTAGKMGSGIGKLLIFEREAPFLGRELSLLLVSEVLGD